MEFMKLNSKNKSTGKVTTKNECYFCHKIIKKTVQMRYHLAKKHTMERPYPCDLCTYSTILPSFLKTHSRSHLKVKSFQCQHCRKSFPWRYRLQVHVESVHEQMKKHPCPVCDKTFYAKSHCKRHVNSVHNATPGQFRCPKCSKPLKSYDCLKQHMQRHSTERAYICYFCNKAFRTNHLLFCHIVIHTLERSYKCQICQKDFASLSVCARHLTTHNIRKNDHRCNFCSFKFKGLQSLINHIAVRHTNEKPYQCKECDATFFTRGQLYGHKISHHRTLTHDRPMHECPICRKLFTTKYYVKHHVKIIHQNERRTLNCYFCNKVCTWYSVLKGHLRTHTMERPYKCPQCNIWFKAIGEHVKNYCKAPGLKLSTYECPICKKLFKAESSVKIHVKTIHKKEGKAWLCYFCKKRCNRYTSLRDHLKVHTMERPNKCPKCKIWLSARIGRHVKFHCKGPGVPGL